MLPILYNPVAGSGYALQVLERVKTALDVKKVAYSLHATEAPGHATELARTFVEQGVPCFFALGGDGTLWETVQPMVGAPTALGIIPGGTGNDFIKCTGLPRDPVEALLCQLGREGRPCDLVRLNRHVYLNVAGTGFDVEVLRFAEKYKTRFRGLWPYLAGVIAALRQFRPVPLRLTVDGAPMDASYTIVSVGNGQYFGGGMRPTPKADPADGLLDVMLAEALPAGKILRLLPRFIRGNHLGLPMVRYLNARRVHISGDNLSFNMDGNLFPISDADIEILPGAIRLLV